MMLRRNANDGLVRLSALALPLLYMSASACAVMNPSPEPPVAITLRSDFYRVALYEAIPVVVRIENIGDSSIEIDPRAFIESDVGSFRVVRPGGSVIAVHRPQYGPRIFGFTRPAQINPGKSIEFRFNLCCNWGNGDTPVFDAVGEYTIVAQYEAESWSVRSDPLPVRITEPPDSDKPALKFMQRLKTPAMLYEANIGLLEEEPEMRAAINQLAALTDSKIYANYARLNLAQRSLQWAATELNGENPAAAGDHIRQAEEWLAGITASEFTLAADVQRAKESVTECRKYLEDALRRSEIRE